MAMMNGLDACDLDMLDEEFFGPPPRFLLDRSPSVGGGEHPYVAHWRALCVWVRTASGAWWKPRAWI